MRGVLHIYGYVYSYIMAYKVCNWAPLYYSRGNYSWNIFMIASSVMQRVFFTPGLALQLFLYASTEYYIFWSLPPFRNDALFLTWRLDPEESLGDWTIIVQSIETADGSNNNNKDNRDDDNASNEDTFSQYSTDYNNDNDNNNTSYKVFMYIRHNLE